MLCPVVCMRGPRAAELLYSRQHFTRVGAMPITAVTMLQDFGSVQTLNDSAHGHRKAMFLSLMSPGSRAVQRIGDIFRHDWMAAAKQWEREPQIVLFDRVRHILTRTALSWSGIPFTERELALRTTELSETIEAAGKVDLRNLKGQLLRQRSELWVRKLVNKVRSGELQVNNDSALATIAHHREQDGRLLTPAVAGVELLNILRPIVAVARYIVFAAKALHEHPDAHTRICAGDDALLHSFVQEVRRTTPFFPVMAGRAREDFVWYDHHFRKGDWLVLDLYGTNLYEPAWDQARQFKPDRFIHQPPDLFAFVPQGAGTAPDSHRCPGEAITIELMKVSIQMLCTMQYRVPPQDLSVAMVPIPALPRSGFILSNVNVTAAAASAS